MMHVEWLKLVNCGEYFHPKGTQLLDSQSAERIIDSFHSLRSRLMRRFQGLPIFIGHPDDPEFGSKNNRVYGRIENMKVEDNALWILVKWTDIGQELFKNGILRYLSPRWLTTPTQDGRLSPKRLLSVGLTNHPNIRCDHVSKVEKANGQIASPDDNNRENFAIDGQENCRDVSSENIFLESEEDQPGQQVTDSVDEDILILPSQIILHTVSQTEDLKQPIFNKSNCERILELVFERMQKFSEKYNDAWNAVKRNNPALFNKNF
ncbi:MAG: phage protease [Puniceicoccales bacterium]|nr:phage protease [Puniceicoccales bacterium]